MSRIAVDFDGTLVTAAWPEVGEFFPGAVDAMNELNACGHTVFLYTARLSPLWPDGSARPVHTVLEDFERVRTKLDSAGLSWMEIWEGAGKPNWDLLIDDKAMWFPGRTRSWKVITPKILARVGDRTSAEAIMRHAREAE